MNTPSVSVAHHRQRKGRRPGAGARFAAYALFRRAAEAATIRAAANALLDGQGGNRALVVLGDTNDEPEAATTQTLYGPQGSEIGTLGFSRPDDGDGQRLWNLAARIPQMQRFSRRYRGRHELIDHIFVSKALVDQVVDGAVTDAAEILGPTARSTTTPTNAATAPAPTTGPFSP